MESFDNFAEEYDRLLRDPIRDRFAGGRDFFVQQKCRVLLRRLGALRGGTANLRLLDVGCGQGTALRLLRGRARVFGSDVSAPMLRAAADRGRVVVQEPYRLPFADGTFDAAFAFCIYHHIPSDGRRVHLCELRRVVAPGGHVFVFEHNPFNPITARVFARAPVDRGCSMIAPARLRALFGDAGFSDIDHGYLLFVPEALTLALGFLEAALSWVPLGGQYFVSGRVAD
jgi:SAM-dependent methyltransferase